MTVSVAWLGGIEPWCFRVEAQPGESFGHFLARFRRANTVTTRNMATVLGVPANLVARWEVPSMGQLPTEEHLLRLSQLTGVAVEHLRAMLSVDRSDRHLGTRLCSMCYAEVAVHLVVWQLKSRPWCERHAIQLLSACPQCGTGFTTPSHWEVGACSECLLPYAAMSVYQQLYQEVVSRAIPPTVVLVPRSRCRNRSKISPTK
jgi:transcriptional regulator with XRE-family HTH domain